MSGFALVRALDGVAVSDHEIRRLLPALLPRGPHAREHWCAGPVAIASTLLETGDARLRARVCRIDDRFLVSGHVRLDDRDHLVRTLTTEGRRVKAADSDLLLFAQAWSHWGASALDHLLGDFSAVVHDGRDGTTHAIRDPFGVRPLYFGRTSTRLIVSNTLQAVLAAPGISRALNADAITDFLAMGLNEDLDTTTFRDIRRLRPGHTITWSADGERLQRYWTLPEPGERRLSSPAEYSEGFREVIATAVRDRLRGSAVSIFMSGGLDSTSLATLAAREIRQGTARTSLQLVTQEPFRELAAEDIRRARLMAAHLALPHTILRGAELAFMPRDDAPELLRPEPYDDPDVGQWHAMLASAARHGPVALYGEDPDTLLRPPDLVTMLRTTSPLQIARRFLHHLLATRERPHLGLRDTARRTFGLVEAPEQAPPWVIDALRVRRAERIRARTPITHRTRPRTAIALANPLWQSLLEALDAGAHGLPLEVRLPFLDLRVVEFALSVPPIPYAQRKHLLREAMRGLLPEEVRTAPKRGVAGYHEARIVHWWDNAAAPFAPSRALKDFIDPSALPAPTPATPAHEMTLHLRVRQLDRWLRAQGHG